MTYNNRSEFVLDDTYSFVQCISALLYNFQFPFPLLEFTNILWCIFYTHWNKPAVKLYNFKFVIMFRLTPVFCYWATISSIFIRKAFLWNLFMKWCPDVAMNLDLKHTYGPSGVLVDKWFRIFARFVLKNSEVCVCR